MAVIRLVTFVTLVCGTAAAQAKHVPPAVAVRHYKAGDDAYQNKDFKKAIEEFSAAYVIDPAPLLLFNMAQAYRLDGRFDNALHLYKLYLEKEKDPRAKWRREARDKIAELSDLLKRQEAGKDAPPVGTADIQSSPPAEQPKEQPVAVVAPPATPPAPAPLHNPFKVPGIGLAAGGGALAIIGLGFAASAPGLSRDANHASTIADGRNEHNRAVAFSDAGWSLIGIGAAVAIAGVVLIALPRRVEKRRASIDPTGVKVTW